MKNWKYLLAILAIALASCTEEIQPQTEEDNQPNPIGTPPRP
jgi:hypothetical protein